MGIFYRKGKSKYSDILKKWLNTNKSIKIQSFQRYERIKRKP